jgi:predicted RNase H-like HicB family nuclease
MAARHLAIHRARCYTGNMKINAVLEAQPEGGYTAYIPALPGCVSEGETEKEAKKNLLDALEGYLTVANKRSLSLARAKDSKVFALQV